MQQMTGRQMTGRQMTGRQVTGRQVTGRQVTGIRADANGEIASGHIMRCIAIAKELQKRRQRVIFFTADHYAEEMLEQAGMEHVCLNTSWKEMRGEAGRLREELEKAGCSKLLVDSYQVTREYLKGLRDICKIIYIDDCFEDVYPADMIINYNAYHVRFPYRDAYKGKARLLLGTEYVPLREEFGKGYPRGEGNEGIHGAGTDRPGIFLSSGGGDVCDALSGILSAMAGREEFADAVFHAAVGRFNPNREKLEALAGKSRNVRLHYNAGNMAELMGQCELAVSAAGTVLFELCAMGIPAVFFACADNQQYDSEFFAREERMLFAGDIRKDREGCLRRICGGARTLMEDGAMRERMKKKLRRVTDGQGAARIAEEICGL